MINVSRPEKIRYRQAFVFNLLFFNGYRLLIFGFRFFHDLDIKRVYVSADFLSDREHIGAVNEPFIIICHDFHLIVNTFENQMGDNAVGCVPSSGFTRSISSGRITTSTGLLLPNPSSTHGKFAPRILTSRS